MINDDIWFEARNITCLKNDFEVVKNLNLSLKINENVALIGPNGSGKSSLIELINRNIYPVIDNKTVLKIFNKKLINIWELRQRVSTVNTEIKSRINSNLTLFDLIISGLYGKFCFISHKSEEDISRAENLINKMNLNNLSQKCFSYMSDGEKQISLIARALINMPDILILDEPTSNLDYKSKYFLIDQIDQLSKLNTKIFCVTHDITLITNIYDRIILLKERSIIADGNQTKIINSENINKLFDIDVEIFKYQNSWNITRNTKELL